MQSVTFAVQLHYLFTPFVTIHHGMATVYFLHEFFSCTHRRSMQRR